MWGPYNISTAINCFSGNSHILWEKYPRVGPTNSLQLTSRWALESPPSTWHFAPTLIWQLSHRSAKPWPTLTRLGVKLGHRAQSTSRPDGGHVWVLLRVLFKESNRWAVRVLGEPAKAARDVSRHRIQWRISLTCSWVALGQLKRPPTAFLFPPPQFTTNIKPWK